MADFTVDSKGYCFLCLDEINSPQPTPDKSTVEDDMAASVYSLLYLSRYLKMDMTKVFIEGGSIPPRLLAQVENSRLKVKLCGECACLVDNVSKLCRQLEKLKMDVESGLNCVHEKLLGAEKTGKTERFRRLAALNCSESNKGTGGWMEILEVLRMETKEKCIRKINKSSPRLRVPKLTKQEIKRRTFRKPAMKINPTPEAGLNTERMSDPHHTIIKSEEPITLDCSLEDDYFENSFAEDSEPVVEDWTSLKIEYFSGGDKVENAELGKKATDNNAFTSVIPSQSNIDVGNQPKRNWTINPETSKHKCRLCSLEFSYYQGFYVHYNAAHRNIKYRCNICGKEFGIRHNYVRHHRSAHAGVKFRL